LNRYHEDKEQRGGEEVSDSYLVINQSQDLVPVEFGTQPNPDHDAVEDLTTTTKIPDEGVTEQPEPFLNTKSRSCTTTTDPHEDDLPGGENDYCSDISEVEVEDEGSRSVETEPRFSVPQEDLCVDHFPCGGSDEVLVAEIIEDAVRDVSERLDALVVKAEACLEYSPQVQKTIELYERSGIIPRGVHELSAWAEVEIGEYVKLYRKSGRVLSSKPNDIVSGFRKFLIETKQAANPIAWITKMEGDPKRWGELADMVQEWQKKEFINSEEGKKLKMEYYESTGLGVTGRWQLD
jgi:hypothetical protein